MRASEPLQAFVKVPHRDIKHRRQWSRTVSPEDFSIIAVQFLKYVCQQLFFELNYLFRTIDESKFKIERIIFREMPAACVGLCAIDMPGLKNPLEGGDAVLFIELRTLGQIGGAFEVLYRKEITSA